MSTTAVLLFSLFTEKKDSILPESEKGATNLTKDPLNKFDAPTPDDQLIKVPWRARVPETADRYNQQGIQES